MAIFIEKDDYEFFLRSAKFCENIDKYSAQLELDPVEVISYKNENDLFNYVFAHKASYGSLAESFMRYKIGNMEELFYDLVAKCKKSRNYTSYIGADLGILCNEIKSYPINQNPVATITLNPEGHPILRWMERFLDGVEIWKDSGDGKGYQKLSRCTGLDYVDKSMLPINGHEVWKYCLIYVFKEEMVGNWSDEQEAIVGRQRISR